MSVEGAQELGLHVGHSQIRWADSLNSKPKEGNLHTTDETTLLLTLLQAQT